MSEQIRIAIVDDHAIVRQGLRALLTNMQMAVVAEGESGREAVSVAAAHKPDVMLLDIRMKDGDGLTALPEVKAASPETQVIMLTTYSNPAYLTQALSDGACGYLLKDTAPEEILAAIETAVSRSRLIDPSLLSMALQGANGNGNGHDGFSAVNGAPADGTMATDAPASTTPAPGIEPLSEREKDVLRLMARGMTNPAIAKQLMVSVTTVKTHVTHILRKLNVSDRTQAVLTAVRHNLVE